MARSYFGHPPLRGRASGLAPGTQGTLPQQGRRKGDPQGKNVKPTTERKHRVMLVEDDPIDVRRLRDAFGRRPHPPQIVDRADGRAALDYLSGEEGQQARPDLILVDLKLPRAGGRDFVATVKSDPRLRQVPVVVFTTSSSETDVNKLYQLHVNGYLVKPADQNAVSDLVELIDHYWLTPAGA